MQAVHKRIHEASKRAVSANESIMKGCPTRSPIENFAIHRLVSVRDDPVDSNLDQRLKEEKGS